MDEVRKVSAREGSIGAEHGLDIEEPFNERFNDQLWSERLREGTAMHQESNPDERY